jgi:hypothetical protein
MARQRLRRRVLTSGQESIVDVRIGALFSRRLRVYADGRFVAAYTLGRWKPYIYPLLTPNGVPVTEESPADHPHHHSVWLGQDEVNGQNFWLNDSSSGHVVGDAPQTAVVETPDGNAATFRQELTWRAADGRTCLEERRVTAITPASGATIVDVLSERQAVTESVELGATKEAGFGFRVHDALDEADGGTLVNSHGDQGEQGTFDRDADWIDYWGTLGDRSAGIALFPHPDNPRHPWFTRAYGLVLCNHHRLQSETLLPGHVLRLQWRVVAHDGSTDDVDVASHYAGYRLACRSWLQEVLSRA